MPDVTVIGGGMAGLAASLHLASAGMEVICIEPQSGPRQPVGESLDWSTPALLGQLGLPMLELVGSGFATYKRGVTLRLADGRSQKYFPGPWLGEPPFNIELRTLHVDRTFLDQQLIDRAAAKGVTLVADRAVSIERRGDRVLAVRTAQGASYTSPWFVDASGFATTLLAREFQIPSVAYGPRKVALWTYFANAATSEGTTIYSDSGGDFLEWIWEIPITATVTSVGCVRHADSIKEERKQNLSLEEILRAQLARFPRFAPLLEAGWIAPPKTVTFACRTYKELAGPNWIIIGEAASLVDPITSNGVTAALRQAAEAVELITAARAASELSPGGRRLFSRRVMQLSSFFNCGIHDLVYDWPVRRRIGLARAARIYTVGAWGMNAIYSRLQPRGWLRVFLFGRFLAVMKAGASIAHALFRSLSRPSGKG